jgi:uncharacterized Zn finger protein
MAASFRWEDFLASPSLVSFSALAKASGKAGIHQPVREAALHYLETGRLPGERTGWPLCATGTAQKPRGETFPQVATLIEIALAEKRPADALHWYDSQKGRNGPAFFCSEDRLAQAVAQHAPERAAALWQRLAERHIALVNPAAYREAVGFLKKLQKLRAEQGQKEQFREYIQVLRDSHRRKKRLVEWLDRLT